MGYCHGLCSLCARRQHLEEERRLWEQHMHAELHAQHTAVHDQHQQRLWSLTQELQEQERLAATQLKAEQDARLTALRVELQVGWGTEVALQCCKQTNTAMHHKETLLLARLPVVIPYVMILCRHLFSSLQCITPVW